MYPQKYLYTVTMCVPIIWPNDPMTHRLLKRIWIIRYPLINWRVFMSMRSRPHVSWWMPKMSWMESIDCLISTHESFSQSNFTGQVDSQYTIVPPFYSRIALGPCTFFFHNWNMNRIVWLNHSSSQSGEGTCGRFQRLPESRRICGTFAAAISTSPAKPSFFWSPKETPIIAGS